MFLQEKEDLAPPGHPNPQQKVQAGFGTPAKGGQTRKHTTWPMCAILVAPRSLCIYFNIFFSFMFQLRLVLRRKMDVKSNIDMNWILSKNGGVKNPFKEMG